MMENEVWKDIIGYEGFYEVSNFGRVRSLKFGKAKVLNSVIGGCGYFVVNLYKAGNRKQVTIHSLVATSFIDPYYRKSGLVVNHKDFNRQNNLLSNLEVVTVRENTNHKHLPSISKYTGVCMDKGKWKSVIWLNGKSIHFGRFDTEIEASEYYEAALICIKEGRRDDIVFKRKESKGYYFDKKYKKWRAYAKENGKRKYLGHFKSEEEAILAVKKRRNNTILD